jgi:hypothetical protein
MLCNKLCRDITIRLVTTNFQSCILYSVTLCIKYIHFLTLLTSALKMAVVCSSEMFQV